MTRAQALHKIREACVRANPEISELKFGCEVIDNLNGITDYSRVFVYVGKGRTYHHLILKGAKAVAADWKFRDEDFGEQNYKIIGRPIRLADVLLAMKARTVPITNTAWRDFKIDAVELLCVYSLRKDSLEEQSDETLLFIASLLV